MSASIDLRQGRCGPDDQEPEERAKPHYEDGRIEGELDPRHPDLGAAYQQQSRYQHRRIERAEKQVGRPGKGVHIAQPAAHGDESAGQIQCEGDRKAGPGLPQRLGTGTPGGRQRQERRCKIGRRIGQESDEMSHLLAADSSQHPDDAHADIDQESHEESVDPAWCGSQAGLGPGCYVRSH